MSGLPLPTCQGPIPEGFDVDRTAAKGLPRQVCCTYWCAQEPGLGADWAGTNRTSAKPRQDTVHTRGEGGTGGQAHQGFWYHQHQFLSFISYWPQTHQDWLAQGPEPMGVPYDLGTHVVWLRHLYVTDSHAKEPITSQSNDEDVGNTVPSTDTQLSSSWDPLDDTKIPKPGIGKSYVPNHKEVTTDDVINLNPFKNIRLRVGNVKTEWNRTGVCIHTHIHILTS